MKKDKLPVQRSSMYRIIRSYIISSICVVCIIALSAGILSADANTKQLSLGEKETTLALAHREQKLEVKINKEKAAAIELPSLESLDFFLSFSPLYWLADSVAELF